jgi:catechol 2,3-dioxygenase-like lactoylglutathione lyase family enzyme
MTSTEASTDPTTHTSSALGTDMALEVVTLPVADVDHAKSFYANLGWRLDADIARGDDFRVVQFTPPHSAASIHFGVGLTAAAPGSVERIILAVRDIEAARADLTSRGVEVSEVQDTGSSDSPESSYFLYASFRDPDGNGWLLQQITTRLPGREWED